MGNVCARFMGVGVLALYNGVCSRFSDYDNVEHFYYRKAKNLLGFQNLTG